ncbi:MAG: condensation domain-containing protein [Pseudomonadota bacterium]
MPQQDANARRRNIETITPLAPLQEGILFHTLLSDDKSIYMPQMAYFLAGPVDAERLRLAWKEVLARHSALRSGIHWEERDEPFQVVYRQLPLTWEALDWSEGDSETQLRAQFAENRAHPFDLRRPPLLRLQLAHLVADRHVLILCFHHIILDGWSTARMLQDVMAFYHGHGDKLPPSPPYAAYIRWMKRQDQDKGREFWKRQIDGTPGPSLAFGQDSDRPVFERGEWSFPDPLADSVTTFCAERGVTLSTLLHAVLGLFIAEHLGRSDVFFGSATAGRPASLEGATDIVGLFLNALPVRIKLDPNETLIQWLNRLQVQQAATTEHEYIALRDIQGNLGTLFDCLLVVENYPVTVGPTQSDITLERVEFDEWTHFPLTILVAPAQAGMKLILRRDKTVIDDGMLQQFLERFKAILEQTINAPDTLVGTCVGELTVLPPATQEPKAVGPIRDTSTETEATVAEIWADVLRSSRPKASDNFFAIGGHSLLAAKVVTRIRKRFDIGLPVRVMFDKPVLADLALHIDALRVTSEPQPGDAMVEF